MAHTLSTAKRIRQNEKRRTANRAIRSRVHTSERKVREAVEKGDGEEARKALPTACSVIDRAAKKRVFHPNAAARKKSRLSRDVARMEQKKAD